MPFSTRELWKDRKGDTYELRWEKSFDVFNQQRAELPVSTGGGLEVGFTDGVKADAEPD